jgi:hypothetical protein
VACTPDCHHAHPIVLSTNLPATCIPCYAPHFSIICYWYVQCKRTADSESDLFVKVPRLPLGLDWQRERFDAVSGAYHRDLTICITAASTNKRSGCVTERVSSGR